MKKDELTNKDLKEFIKVIESNPEFFRKHVDVDSMEELKRSALECYDTYCHFTDLLVKNVVELFGAMQSVYKVSQDGITKLED